jgi:hypothetical protein
MFVSFVVGVLVAIFAGVSIVPAFLNAEDYDEAQVMKSE